MKTITFQFDPANLVGTARFLEAAEGPTSGRRTIKEIEEYLMDQAIERFRSRYESDNASAVKVNQDDMCGTDRIRGDVLPSFGAGRSSGGLRREAPWREDGGLTDVDVVFWCAFGIGR